MPVAAAFRESLTPTDKRTIRAPNQRNDHRGEAAHRNTIAVVGVVPRKARGWGMPVLRKGDACIVKGGIPVSRKGCSIALAQDVLLQAATGKLCSRLISKFND